MTIFLVAPINHPESKSLAKLLAHTVRVNGIAQINVKSRVYQANWHNLRHATNTSKRYATYLIYCQHTEGERKNVEKQKERDREPIIILSLWWPCNGYVESVTSQYFISVSNFGGACTFRIVYCVSSDFSFLWIFDICQKTMHFEGISMAVGTRTHSFSFGWILIRVERKIVYWLEKLGLLLVDASMTRDPHKWNGPTQITLDGWIDKIIMPFVIAARRGSEI